MHAEDKISENIISVSDFQNIVYIYPYIWMYIQSSLWEICYVIPNPEDNF